MQRELLLLLQNTHDDVNPPREGEKWRNANYAEMSRIFHGKSTGERSEEGGNINIPLPLLACSSLFPLPPSLPFCFLSRVAFDSAKLHENVSPSISLKSHRSGLNSLLRLTVMQ